MVHRFVPSWEVKLHISLLSIRKRYISDVSILRLVESMGSLACVLGDPGCVLVVNMSVRLSAARSALPGPGLRRLPRRRSVLQRRAHGDVQVSNHVERTS